MHCMRQEEAAAGALAPLPARLLNNAAVLHMRGGEPGAALDLMQEAIRVRLVRCFVKLFGIGVVALRSELQAAPHLCEGR